MNFQGFQVASCSQRVPIVPLYKKPGYFDQRPLRGGADGKMDNLTMHQTDQQSGSFSRYTTELNGGGQMTNSNKMWKAISQMDQQTLTEH